jgi:hypothetical protein
MKPVPTYELLLGKQGVNRSLLPSLVNFFSPENSATENIGQGTGDCGVGSNHQPPYGDRQPKYPQSSPLTEMHEQGASPWLRNREACSSAQRERIFAQDFGSSGLPLTLTYADALKLGE